MGLVELAKIAGVSVSTASRALSNHPRVAKATRERILYLAKELGFRLNQTASALRKQRTGAIGVVVPLGHERDQSLSDPFFMGLLGGLADALAKRSYDLLLSRVVPEGPDWLEDIIAAGRVDGIILIGQSNEIEAIERAAERYPQMIVWGAARLGSHQVTVGTDNLTGGELAARHLLQRGCRRLAFLGSPDVPEFADRYRGFHAAVAEATDVTAVVVPMHLTLEDAYREISGYLATHPAPDGIFAASDVVAMSAMRALSDRGLRVPADVAVVGYDDIVLAPHTSPPLTTVRQDVRYGAELMVELLLARIGGATVGSVAMQPELIVRGSA
ncbi:LacI family DNA-binding transcriptional regulator [Sphingomonas pokkalii]|uniref:LacI family transcriptional regulator n=1 Tax=Sphingomonas pokkalii TaxID=2175090 RepID=A0A2U0SF93_9SPHN|nr:substrate-binding domain-containing protein [Sphingomonas pokkalii]PVX30033.1 LacI family transcriptional regulator [Sphingomonas pokkalii]